MLNKENISFLMQHSWLQYERKNIDGRNNPAEF